LISVFVVAFFRPWIGLSWFYGGVFIGVLGQKWVERGFLGKKK
jgi:hypothetical protein